MNMNAWPRLRRVALPVAFHLLLLGGFGCATKKIDWSARVGSYTFDQAVLEMGPPAKQAKLEDGILVAEWMTQRGYTQTSYAPYYGYGYRPYGPVVAVPMVTSSPDVFIRLIFNPGGKLVSWKKVSL